MSCIHWLTFESHPKRNPRAAGSLIKMKATAKHRFWTVNPMGGNEEFLGFCQKWIGIREYIKNRPDHEIVVVTDARDVLVNRTPDGFVETYHSMGPKGKDFVVFGTEKACCVMPMYDHKPGAFVKKSGGRKALASAPSGSDDTDFRDFWTRRMKARVPKSAPKAVKDFYALNGGMACGTVGAWRTVLAKLDPLDPDEDDQALFTELQLMFPALVKCDYYQKLFSNSNVWDKRKGCFFAWDAKKKSFRNTRTKQTPYFIQTPGAEMDVKPFWCYNQLYAKLKK